MAIILHQTKELKQILKLLKNTLEKLLLLLRGIEPAKKKLGLIAHEVEIIIPEIVGFGEETKLNIHHFIHQYHY